MMTLMTEVINMSLQGWKQMVGTDAASASESGDGSLPQSTSKLCPFSKVQVS